MNELKYYLHGPKKGQPVMQKDMDVLSAAIANMEYAGVGVADRYFECAQSLEFSHFGLAPAGAVR